MPAVARGSGPHSLLRVALVTRIVAGLQRRAAGGHALTWHWFVGPDAGAQDAHPAPIPPRRPLGRDPAAAARQHRRPGHHGRHHLHQQGDGGPQGRPRA